MSQRKRIHRSKLKQKSKAVVSTNSALNGHKTYADADILFSLEEKLRFEERVLLMNQWGICCQDEIRSIKAKMIQNVANHLGRSSRAIELQWEIAAAISSSVLESRSRKLNNAYHKQVRRIWFFILENL